MSIGLFVSVAAGLGWAARPAAEALQQRYVLQREKDLPVKQPGPHRGGGTTTAYPFFGDVSNLELVFRKRTLHPGSAIGYHEQHEDEIYYVVSGNGVMLMNGDSFPVTTGDAVLTRPGSSHGLHPRGTEDLTILIVYKQSPQRR